MLQSRLGDKLLGFRVVCPLNGAAVLKGLGLLEVLRPRDGDLKNEKCGRMTLSLLYIYRERSVQQHEYYHY